MAKFAEDSPLVAGMFAAIAAGRGGDRGLLHHNRPTGLLGGGELEGASPLEEVKTSPSSSKRAPRLPA